MSLPWQSFLAHALWGYGESLAVVLPIALLNIWLLRRRWLAHLNPLPRGAGTPWWKQALTGAVAACFALMLTLLPGLLAGAYNVGQPYRYMLTAGGIPFLLELKLTLLTASLFEEALFRGLGLGLLAMLLLWVADMVTQPRALLRFGSANFGDDPPAVALYRRRAWLIFGLLANLVTAAAFGLAHLGNAHFTPLGGVNVALAGLWLGLLFWRYANLWACWAAHFTWNLGLAALGLPVSGIALAYPPLGVGFTSATPGLLTGGSFGPEGSLPFTVALAVLSLSLGWLVTREALGVRR